MNLDEYREWLKNNGHNEEVAAYNVVKKLVDWHTYGQDNYKLDIIPHQWFDTGEEKLEFDLLIELTFFGSRCETKRVIGVEFKEYDCRKVINQAILRREYVDYMWIATNYCVLDEVSLLEMVDNGIGWIIWDYDGFVKIVIPAKYSKESSVVRLMEYLAERAIEREIARRKEEAKTKSLFEFIG